MFLFGTITKISFPLLSFCKKCAAFIKPPTNVFRLEEFSLSRMIYLLSKSNVVQMVSRNVVPTKNSVSQSAKNSNAKCHSVADT